MNKYFSLTLFKTRSYGVPALLLFLIAFGFAGIRADEIDDYLRAQMTKNQIPGLSLAVVRSGKIIKLKSYGVATLEWNQPVTPETAFQIASSTKPFTGTALMMLVEEGKLSLDDKISKYLPDAPASWQNITVRQLATHSSGITSAVSAKPGASVEEFVKAAYPLALDYQPGAKAMYGLTDFVVLQYIIEKVSGQPFTDFLKTKLFDRFQMANSRFEFATEMGDRHYANVIKNRATVYQRDGDQQKVYWYLYPPRTYSAGGLFSTAADIAKLAVAFDEGKVLTPKTLDQMWQRDKLGDGSLNGFGIGWVVGTYNGQKIVGHSGGPALGDILRFPDEKLTIIVLSNEQRLYPYLAKGIADIYLPYPPPVQVLDIKDNDAELTRIVKKFLADGMQDKVDPALFSEKTRQEFIPGFQVFGLPFFASLDPLDSLVLLEHKEERGNIKRRYRGVYGNKAVAWIFEFDKDKKILSVDSKQEES